MGVSKVQMNTESGVQTIMDLTNLQQITGPDYIVGKINDSASWISNNRGLSNLQSGLILAKDILDNSNTGALAENKHVILITDGAAFTYNNKDNVTASTVYKVSGTMYLSMGNMDSNGDVGSPSRETKSTQYLSQNNDDYKAYTEYVNQKEFDLQDYIFYG